MTEGIGTVIEIVIETETGEIETEIETVTGIEIGTGIGIVTGGIEIETETGKRRDPILKSQQKR